MKSASVKTHQIVSGFLSYLKKTHQFHLLPQLAQEQLRQAKLQLDADTAIVHTALPLSSPQTAKLQTTLSHIFSRPIKVKNHLNPQLIAGLRIKVGDKLIDLSLSTKLEHLYEQLNR